MKRLLSILFMALLCIGMVGCSKQVEQKTEESAKDEPIMGMANPMVEYDSLEEINEKVGVQIVTPGIMGKDNEKFFVISDNLAQYNFDLNGYSFTIRGSKKTDVDISGIHDENNVFEPGQDTTIYLNDCYIDRFFDVDKQYTIVCDNPEGLDETVFSDLCFELESIMKWHTDDPLVGDYQDSVSQRASLTVERHGEEYVLVVNWASSASENTCWTMYATKDGNKLNYAGENIAHTVYDADGNTVSNDETASDNIGYFTIMDNGELHWSEASEDNLEECKFVKINY